jgi:acetyl-CoA carboxylase carboxyl transferase subunit beta
MLSLVQMAKTGAAAARLHRAGVPFVCVLTNPTTGGVLASYATQGDVLLAEPGALIGFAGPRVVREVTGRELLPDFPTAEFLLGHGLIDAVVERSRLRETLGVLLELGVEWPHPLTPSPAALERGNLRAPGEGVSDPLSLWERVSVRASSLGRRARRSQSLPASAWEAIETARHPERPTAVDYLNRLLARFVELHGDRAGADDPAIVGGIGELGGTKVVVIAQERGRGSDAARRKGGRAGPGGYRKALRLMRLAVNLRLPLLTLVDTPGAELSVDAEAGGLAWTISACLAELSALPLPVVSVVIGEGGSGGALALSVGDRVLMQENAIYSVIAPEGAAAILYHSRDRAPEVAAALKLTAADCRRLGVVDVVVAEPPGGAHRDPDRAAELLGKATLIALQELVRVPAAKLVEARYRKYQGMGRYDTRLHRLVNHWLSDARSAAARAVGRLLGAVDRRPLTPRGDSARDTYVEATRSRQDGD